MESASIPSGSRIFDLLLDDYLSPPYSEVIVDRHAVVQLCLSMYQISVALLQLVLLLAKAVALR